MSSQQSLASGLKTIAVASLTLIKVLLILFCTYNIGIWNQNRLWTFATHAGWVWMASYMCAAYTHHPTWQVIGKEVIQKPLDLSFFLTTCAQFPEMPVGVPCLQEEQMIKLGSTLLLQEQIFILCTSTKITVSNIQTITTETATFDSRFYNFLISPPSKFWLQTIRVILTFTEFKQN